jgi:hypothetical protein
MTRSYAQQKAALTRALNSGNADKVRAEVKRTVEEWDETGWPDDWSRWQRALADATGDPFVDIDHV